MRRTPIPLDEETHAALRRLAYEQGRSMASVVRDTLARALLPGGGAGKPPSRRRLAFVGAGRSDQKRLTPVSERHDEALAEAFLPKKHR